MEREYTKNEIMSVKRPLLFIKSSYPIIQISDNIKLERERERDREERILPRFKKWLAHCIHRRLIFSYCMSRGGGWSTVTGAQE